MNMQIRIQPSQACSLLKLFITNFSDFRYQTLRYFYSWLTGLGLSLEIMSNLDKEHVKAKTLFK